MSREDLIRRLDDVGIGDRKVVGGKGASLGELCRAGLPVPDGFAVTALAFERAIHAAGAADRISGEIETLDAADTNAIAQTAARR